MVITLLRNCLFLFVALFLIAVPAAAQLGPKDGADLAATDIKRVKISDSAPDFTLQNKDGKNISLSDYRGKNKVVLVFYRGHW
jgi:cytochrome oxidase Cu insertion factor (SCO1/SenC/PrrC family)